MFQTNNCPYDLRNQIILASKHKSTIKYSINTIAFKGPEIWKNNPLEIRNTESDTALTLPLQKFVVHSQLI